MPASPLGLSAAEVAALLARGDALFALGDAASARLYYERAVDAGERQAALKLGKSFDPVFLSFARLHGVRGDTDQAASWYRRARDLGDSEAEILLKGLEPGITD
jgi:TPR repeat protein